MYFQIIECEVLIKSKIIEIEGIQLCSARTSKCNKMINVRTNLCFFYCDIFLIAYGVFFIVKSDSGSFGRCKKSY